MHHPSLSVARLLLVVTIVAFTSTSFSVLAKQLGAKKGSVQHQVLLQERANSSVQEDAGQGDAGKKTHINILTSWIEVYTSAMPIRFGYRCTYITSKRLTFSLSHDSQFVCMPVLLIGHAVS